MAVDLGWRRGPDGPPAGGADGDHRQGLQPHRGAPQPAGAERGDLEPHRRRDGDTAAAGPHGMGVPFGRGDPGADPARGRKHRGRDRVRRASRAPGDGGAGGVRRRPAAAGRGRLRRGGATPVPSPRPGPVPCGVR